MCISKVMLAETTFTNGGLCFYSWCIYDHHPVQVEEQPPFPGDPRNVWKGQKEK